MTEAEAFEVGAAWVSNAITAFTIYISFTFAYLTVAFVTGERLSMFQVAVINVLYSLSAGSAIFSMMNSLMMWESALLHAESAMKYQYFFNNPSFWYSYMAVILSLGILVCLYFMIDVRRQTGSLAG